MKHCKYCTKEFKPKSLKRIFCSDRCKMAFHRKGKAMEQRITITVKEKPKEFDEQKAKMIHDLISYCNFHHLSSDDLIESHQKASKPAEISSERIRVGQVPQKEVKMPKIEVKVPIITIGEISYDFTGKRFLNIEEYTNYPIKNMPKNPWQAKIWNREKQLSDMNIRNAWYEYKKLNNL